MVKKNLNKKSYINYFFKYIFKYKNLCKQLENKTNKFNYNIINNYVKKIILDFYFLKESALQRFYEVKSFNQIIKSIMRIKIDKNIKSSKSNWKFDKNVAKNFDSHVTKSVPFYNISHDLCVSLVSFF